MKKVALILMSGVAAVSVLAQGTVNFGNIGNYISNIDTKARVPAGTVFTAGLYYLPDGPEPATDAFHDALLPNTATFSVAGGFAAGTRSTPSTTPSGGYAWFQVRAWETAFGQTYEQAMAAGPRDVGGVLRQAYIGTSLITRIKTGDPVNAGSPALLNSGTPPFRGFYVAIVPEPTVIGLGLLGIGSLLLLRRRK